jgi:hypothetical protein
MCASAKRASSSSTQWSTPVRLYRLGCTCASPDRLPRRHPRHRGRHALLLVMLLLALLLLALLAARAAGLALLLR